MLAFNGTYSQGYEIPESYLPVSLDNITNNYNEDDAVVKITHENGCIATIRLHPDRAVRFTLSEHGQRLNTAGKFRKAFPISLVIVPALSPLESKEPLVTDDTVNRNRTSRLAARNFRNIWYREDDDSFEVFRQRVEAAWSGVSLQKPELIKESVPPRLDMFFSENRITREIQWAGFGFQVWLQIHTHLLRGNEDSILVLDEPDIYLHPDLQHRLYYDVKNIFKQYFLATHATEIINEAETKEILVINSNSRSARNIKGDNDYETMLSYIGSAQNADFAKISRVRKVVFVEGHDAKILRRLSNKIGLSSLEKDRDSPIFTLGGFSQWKRAQNSIWAFKELLGVEISAICLFDRDYRPHGEVSDFVETIEKSGMACFVFERKEIENYLLSPRAIARLANSRKPGNGLDEVAVRTIIEQEAEEFRNLVMSQISSNYLRYKQECGSKEDASTLLKKSLEFFENEWNSFDGKIRISPGKDLLKRVLDRIQAESKLSLSTLAIASSLRREEIPQEIQEILGKIADLFNQ